MVYAELAQAVLTGVGVAFRDNPGGGIRYTEVEDLARGDKVVEGLHHFGDAGVHVPVVDVELEKEDTVSDTPADCKKNERKEPRDYQVDVGGLQFLQTGFHGDV